LPRPRLVLKPRFIGFEVEEEVYEALRKLAYEKNRSLSSVARELLINALRQLKPVDQGNNPPINPTNNPNNTIDPPQNIDLVVKMDVEELEEEIGEVEKTVKKIEEQLEKNTKLPRNLLEFWFKNNRIKLQETLVRAENKLKKLRQKYYSVKRKARNNSEVEQLASRMYALRSKVKQLEAKLK
jgi:polyhydroxyalkanoate synthesis regulator phasin